MNLKCNISSYDNDENNYMKSLHARKSTDYAFIH